MIHLTMLWHMHQPNYIDPVTGRIETIALILRTLFNYYPMAKLVESFPEVHLSFNLTPVLLTQIEKTAAGEVENTFLQMLAEDGGTEDQVRAFIKEMPEKITSRNRRASELIAGFNAGSLSSGDFSDLQSYLHLLCFNPLIVDDDIKNLLTKAKDFNQADREMIISKEKAILSGTIGLYKSLQDKGQVEISTSPLNHPILPLIIDTESAKRTTTGLTIPDRIFSFPEDAREQIRKGISVYEKFFGSRPSGFWPSEGSLSDETLEMLSEEGILWAATDEKLLLATLGNDKKDEIYKIWRFRDKISIFFRDNTISDMIGFNYQALDETMSARDLIGKIEDTGSHRTDKQLTIILDGENAWDYFPQFGNTFLKEIYKNLAESQTIKTLTFRDALNSGLPEGRLDKIHPGSWMGTNFDNWIGKPPANRAWQILNDARSLAENKKGTLSDEERERLDKYIFLAETSDWFWWYSLHADKNIKLRFDSLFRDTVRNIYKIIGEDPPECLFRPIEEFQSYDEAIPYIKPTIDGVLTHFYEWKNAVEIKPADMWSTFKPVNFPVKKFFYGYDEDNVYIRMDLKKGRKYTIDITFLNRGKKTFSLGTESTDTADLDCSWGEILEVAIPRKKIDSEETKTVYFNINIKDADGGESFYLPARDSFRMEFREEENWIV